MEKFLSPAAVCEVLNMSRATLYRRISCGEIPKPLKDGPRSKWPESSIVPYIERIKSQSQA
ncbi:AlpA family phage regulatory protein [Atlantibacter subterranea]|uniref:AlpA family phage regulatory protein n=1 Tax=Atlantibacter subterraneus TaxID=255519 RepID=A0A427UNN1_9ENTR|nr:AlpA family phage regulatory protein [Atlantibacter subterranea]RSE01164.1 AlpA family phage regulatory protein [Atlantibacter subterranea]RSE22124.1 AlpA family phage regulatory protein [Atlantibacter subterranea]